MNRTVRIYFPSENEKVGYLALNQMYFGPEAIDRVITLLS